MQRIKEWFTRDLWRIRTRDLTYIESWLLKALRVAVLTWQEFWNDRVTLRASAMTFYSLLSLVPLFVIVVSLSSHFGLDDDFVRSVYNAFPEQRQIIDELFKITSQLVQRTATLWATLSGLFVALWSILKVLMHMDRSFTDIWGVKESRPLWRRAVDYFILLIACPSILMLASSINIWLSHELEWLQLQTSAIQYFRPIFTYALVLLPYILIVTLFTFLYLFVPNTRVRFLSGFIGGLIAGALYQVIQWGYIRFQTSVTHFDVVYGSLAAIPLLLVWLELGWLILLVGAEISYAFQNMERYEYAHESDRISLRLYRTLSLYLLTQSVHEREGRVVDLAHRTDLPLTLCERVVAEWFRTGIATAPKEGWFCLDKKVLKWRLKTAVDCLERVGEDELPLPESEAFDHLRSFLHELGETLAQSPANLPLTEVSGHS